MAGDGGVAGVWPRCALLQLHFYFCFSKAAFATHFNTVMQGIFLSCRGQQCEHNGGLSLPSGLLVGMFDFFSSFFFKGS